MSQTPLELMLDTVEWEVLPPPSCRTGGLPYATYHGFLKIGGAELECYVLSDGQRIFTADSVERFVGLTCNLAPNITLEAK